MNPYFGPVEIGQPRNSGPGEIGLLSAQYVYYPDCQQLILWLPEPGASGYGSFRVVEMTRGAIIKDQAVTDLLNGNIQLLLDTLEFAPGTYRIEIDHPEGGMHLLEFQKLEAGAMPDDPNEIPTTNSTAGISTPAAEEEDQILRNNLFRTLKEKFSRRLEYEGNFRSGKIIYKSAERSIEFYHEMGGGKCQFYIDIPTKEQWEAKTGLPLSERSELLHFIAETVQREKAPSWRYEIEDSAIYYYE